MPISLTDIERIANEIAAEENAGLCVVAAGNSGGSADYTEVLLTLHRRLGEPIQLVIGTSRNAAESEVRRLLRDRLRDQLGETG